MTRGERAAAVYLRGGGDEDDFLPGLSDLDLVLVPARDPREPGAAATRVRRRWEALRRGFPPAALVVDWPRVHEDAELAELSGASALTVGLEGGSGLSVYHGERASVDSFRLLGRPGLYEGVAGWRRLAGPDRRPPSTGATARAFASPCGSSSRPGGGGRSGCA